MNDITRIIGPVGSEVCLRLLDLTFTEYSVSLKRSIIEPAGIQARFDLPTSLGSGTADSGSGREADGLTRNGDPGHLSEDTWSGVAAHKQMAQAEEESATRAEATFLRDVEELKRLRLEAELLKQRLAVADQVGERLAESMRECSGLKAELRDVQAEALNHLVQLRGSLRELSAAQQKLADLAELSAAQNTALNAALEREAVMLAGAVATGRAIDALHGVACRAEGALKSIVAPASALQASRTRQVRLIRMVIEELRAAQTALAAAPLSPSPRRRGSNPSSPRFGAGQRRRTGSGAAAADEALAMAVEPEGFRRSSLSPGKGRKHHDGGAKRSESPLSTGDPAGSVSVTAPREPDSAADQEEWARAEEVYRQLLGGLNRTLGPAENVKSDGSGLVARGRAWIPWADGLGGQTARFAASEGPVGPGTGGGWSWDSVSESRGPGRCSPGPAMPEVAGGPAGLDRAMGEVVRLHSFVSSFTRATAARVAGLQSAVETVQWAAAAAYTRGGSNGGWSAEGPEEMSAVAFQYRIRLLQSEIEIQVRDRVLRRLEAGVALHKRRHIDALEGQARLLGTVGAARATATTLIYELQRLAFELARCIPSAPPPAPAGSVAFSSTWM